MPAPWAPRDDAAVGAQIFHHVVGGRHHRVVASPGFKHVVTWTVDGEVVAEKTEYGDPVRLESEEHGQVRVKFARGGAARRATFMPPEPAEGVSPLAALGLGADEIDLAPEPGSPAAHHEQMLLEHPVRYALRQTLVAAAAIGGPIVGGYLLTRLLALIPWPDWSFPSLPSPDLPSIPWPDLPSIDLPSIPFPELPTLPAWVGEVLDALFFVLPVIIAFVLARAEIRRRREQLQRHRGRAEADGVEASADAAPAEPQEQGPDTP